VSNEGGADSAFMAQLDSATLSRSASDPGGGGISPGGVSPGGVSPGGFLGGGEDEDLLGLGAGDDFAFDPLASVEAEPSRGGGGGGGGGGSGGGGGGGSSVKAVEFSPSNYKAASAEADRNRQRLIGLVKRPENSRCADCPAKVGTSGWASVNLGSFLCFHCSGIHRNLGVHISKVRSLSLDSWNDDWVAQMERWGNARAAAYWEARLGPQEGRPSLEDSTEQNDVHKAFIRAKYEGRRWAAAAQPAEWIAASAAAPAPTPAPAPAAPARYDSRGAAMRLPGAPGYVPPPPAAAAPQRPVPSPPPAESCAGSGSGRPRQPRAPPRSPPVRRSAL